MEEKQSLMALKNLGEVTSGRGHKNLFLNQCFKKQVFDQNWPFNGVNPDCIARCD